MSETKFCHRCLRHCPADQNTHLYDWICGECVQRFRCKTLERERDEEKAESERRLQLFKSEQERADRLKDERDRWVKRASDREIECGRLEGLLAAARARARKLWRYCLSWAPTNDAWREIKHETQAEAGDWINE